MEINADYVIRRTILFDNKCGFVLGENPKAPNPYRPEYNPISCTTHPECWLKRIHLLSDAGS